MIGKPNKYLAVPADDDVEDRLDQIADDAVSKSAIVDAEHLSPRPGAASSAVDGSASTSGSTGATAPVATPAAPPAATAAGTPYPAIGFWIFMSCSVILFNKYLYNGTFAHPISLTCIHMLFASCSTWTLRLTGYIDSPKFGWHIWVRNVLPIGILYAASLATSNLGAARLSVSFVQMIKALTPLVTLAVSVALKVEKSDRRQALIVGVMCAGVIVASYGEILWNTAGVMFQVTSVAAEGARLVVTQILLQQHLPKSNPLVSISIFAPPCFLLLLPIALTFEGGAFAKVLDPAIGIVILLNTLTAFVLNLAVVILVQKSSGLVLTLAGIVKDIALIVASIFIFANPVTPIQVVGYGLALLGLNMYNEYKTRKNENTGMLDLLKVALTNKQALFVAGGAAILLLFSLQSLNTYYEAQDNASAAEEAAAAAAAAAVVSGGGGDGSAAAAVRRMLASSGF